MRAQTQKFVFVHIPKAAGTTFYMMLRWHWERNRFKILKGHWGLHDNSEIAADVNENEFYEQYSVVTGHFPYQHYYYLKEKCGWNLITWIRDPVDRVISQYNHFRHRPSLTKKFLSRRIVKKARKANIVEFSKIQSNFQTRYTGEDPSIFDFIGVVEKFHKSFQRFNKQFGFKLRHVESHNVHGWVKREEVHKNVREELKEHHEKDYKFYNEVIKRYR